MCISKLELRDQIAIAAIPALIAAKIEEEISNGSMNAAYTVMEELFQSMNGFADAAVIAYNIADAMLYARMPAAPRPGDPPTPNTDKQ